MQHSHRCPQRRNLANCRNSAPSRSSPARQRTPAGRCCVAATGRPRGDQAGLVGDVSVIPASARYFAACSSSNFRRYVSSFVRAASASKDRAILRQYLTLIMSMLFDSACADMIGWRSWCGVFASSSDTQSVIWKFEKFVITSNQGACRVHAHGVEMCPLAPDCNLNRDTGDRHHYSGEQYTGDTNRDGSKMTVDQARVTLHCSNEVGILDSSSGSAHPDDIALYVPWAFAYSKLG
jgi:hypothetical protein